LLVEAALNVEVANHNKEFALLWAKAFPRVRVFVLMCVPKYHDAEDVIQETAVAAASDFEHYDRQRSFTAWALGIARNRVLRHWRTQSSTRQILLDDETLARIEVAFSQLDMDADLAREALEACLGSLTPRARRLVEHRYVEGMNSEHLAARMGLTVSSVYTQLYRIRQGLAECIRRKMRHGEAT
jgi:RNA polymerase sigma-70 factor, ECF subfamily